MSATLEKRELTLGFIPLTDCAPLVIALEKGWFAKYGLEVRLSRQVSWANIRDKVAVGVLDGAHMLAAMPIATTLGLGEIKQPMVAALSLDLNGNAITVSPDLYQRMAEADPEAAQAQPMTARALARVVAQERGAGRPPMNFAMVFPFSTHHYLLRYWLAAGGIDPDRDTRLLVVPPSYMVECLNMGEIDGYCVGEPWNEQAVAVGVGRTLVTDYDIWNNHPEKVFGVTRDWAERHPHTHRAVLMALLEAARWIDQPEHRLEVAEILAREDYVNAPAEVVKMSMTGSFQYQAGAAPRSCPDFNVFHRYAANFPWRSHAMWFVTQMYRWGQLEEPRNIREVAEQVYRPDLYREAARALGFASPAVDYKAEGGHAGPWTLDGPEPIALGADLYADGRCFDPADPVGYLRQFDIHRLRVSLDQLAGLNP
ncbi:nitrate/nitrite transport system substrate-binding protein [Methylomagnum ishizawai]|uniref:Nitrate/nitrite transport system substrate-binding protein n=1 Tax=Methylomagnum ishizawai TaxID=1760988 RepID=A0A1Y6D8E7_9GAMM|nr:CmpA/NrtA family ABC transporter substrate-binding protein [Methylomagnum ishizawai]SMF97033.1 nitrate/nitrite transport system substrate-binding protein [Methylomagnum ishizawai]